MLIDQANAGAAITSNSASTVYGVDQFNTRGTASEGVYTVQRLSATPPTGFKFYSHIVTTTASATPAAASRYLFRSPIEGPSTRDFLFGTASAKTITLSFWVRSSLTGTFSFSIGGDDGGAGRQYVANYTINSAATWEFKTITLTGDTVLATWPVTTNTIFWLYWDLGCGSNYETTAGSWVSTEKYRTTGSTRLISTNAATMDITGVQLEIGSTATAFEYRPFPFEVQLCQRYLEKSYDLDVVPGTAAVAGAHAGPGAVTNAGSTVTRYTPVVFKITKRVIPTFFLWDSVGASGKVSTTSSADVNTSRVAITATPTAYEMTIRTDSGSDLYLGAGHWLADARL
jgi:hypothetical protein